MAPVRFIVTGLGSWGPGWAELIQQQDGVELAAVVEPMDDRRQAVAEARGLRPDQAYVDLQTALDNVEADAVLVVTRPAPISTSRVSRLRLVNQCSWKNRSPPPWTMPGRWWSWPRKPATC